MTANLFLERTFDEPLTAEDVIEGGRESAQCFDFHRVRWHGSFLSRDGRTMICRFSAADMESARLALRDPGTDLSRLWSGTVHKSGKPGAPSVVVERAFAAPVRFEDIAAMRHPPIRASSGPGTWNGTRISSDPRFRKDEPWTLSPLDRHRAPQAKAVA